MRDTKFENATAAQIALIQAKANAYEALSSQRSHVSFKFLDSFFGMFRKSKNADDKPAQQGSKLEI